jgi:hypothetical protein
MCARITYEHPLAQFSAGVNDDTRTRPRPAATSRRSTAAGGLRVRSVKLVGRVASLNTRVSPPKSCGEGDGGSDAAAAPSLHRREAAGQRSAFGTETESARYGAFYPGPRVACSRRGCWWRDERPVHRSPDGRARRSKPPRPGRRPAVARSLPTEWQRSARASCMSQAGWFC